MKGKEIKLNSYILPDSVKNDMRSTLDETQTLEKGFGLCTKDNIIRRGKDFVGDSNRIRPNLLLGLCDKGEKFLGLYHTHPTSDSQPSAEDIHNCGKFRTMCTGGKSDGKVMCQTYKGEQISTREHAGMLYDLSQGITKTENQKYQSNLCCINSTLPLSLAESYIKKVDKDLGDRRSYLLSLRESDRLRPEIEEERNKLNVDIYLRNIYSDALKEEIKRQSRKYYNETEII